MKVLEIKKQSAGGKNQASVGMVKLVGDNKISKPPPEKVSSIVSQVASSQASIKIPKFIQEDKKKKKKEHQGDDMELGRT